jgi:peptidoglycan/LPS O-acetylase OafA/YrhL
MAAAGPRHPTPKARRQISPPLSVTQTPFSGMIGRAEPGALPARLDRLNTVRSLAIVGVFLVHGYSVVFHSSHEFEIATAGLWPPLRTLAQGFLLSLSSANHLLGVFFLMSGYALHRIFRRWRARNDRLNGRSFAKFFIWHRFWRLVPAFWVALLVAYFFAYQEPFSAGALRKLAVNATLLKTLYPGYFFSINYSHWYVAVQWQLDLLYPVFLFMAWRRSFAVAFGVSCACAILFKFVVPEFTNAPYFVNLPFRWWTEWTLGALIAERHATGRRVFPYPRSTLAALIVLLAASVVRHWGFFGWIVPQLILTLLLECVLLSKSPFKQWERSIAPIGICSYSIYLIHLVVLEQAGRWLGSRGIALQHPLTWLAFCAGCFALTAVVSRMSYRYIEEKSVSLGTRLWRRYQAKRA